MPVRKVYRERAAVRIRSTDRSFGVQTVAAAGNVPLDVVLTPRIGRNRRHAIDDSAIGGSSDAVRKIRGARGPLVVHRK